MPETLTSHVRRRRIITTAAGTITLLAVVLAFASGYLGQQWQWLRPAGELLLLAELVGLIVLERHQLFEPVSERVANIENNTAEIRSTLAAIDPIQIRDSLASLAEHVSGTGQVRMFSTHHEVLSAMTKAVQEALDREQATPQVLRTCVLSGATRLNELGEVTWEIRKLQKALSRFLVLPNGNSDARAQKWSVRVLIGFATIEHFESWFSDALSFLGEGPTNVEIKLVVLPAITPAIAPRAITDREAVLVYGDGRSTTRWGLVLHGDDYTAMMAEWFDDLWARARIPNENLVYAKTGWNQKVIDFMRSQLENRTLIRLCGLRTPPS